MRLSRSPAEARAASSAAGSSSGAPRASSCSRTASASSRSAKPNDRAGAGALSMNGNPAWYADFILRQAAGSSGKLRPAGQCASAETSRPPSARITCSIHHRSNGHPTDRATHDSHHPDSPAGSPSSTAISRSTAPRGFVSAMAVQMQNVAIGWLVYDMHQRSAGAGPGRAGGVPAGDRACPGHRPRRRQVRSPRRPAGLLRGRGDRGARACSSAPGAAAGRSGRSMR